MTVNNVVAYEYISQHTNVDNLIFFQEQKLMETHPTLLVDIITFAPFRFHGMCTLNIDMDIFI
jgi:hypothetical protein